MGGAALLRDAVLRIGPPGLLQQLLECALGVLVPRVGGLREERLEEVLENLLHGAQAAVAEAAPYPPAVHFSARHPGRKMLDYGLDRPNREVIILP